MDRNALALLLVVVFFLMAARGCQDSPDEPEVTDGPRMGIIVRDFDGTDPAEAAGIIKVRRALEQSPDAHAILVHRGLKGAKTGRVSAEVQAYVDALPRGVNPPYAFVVAGPAPGQPGKSRIVHQAGFEPEAFLRSMGAQPVPANPPSFSLVESPDWLDVTPEDTINPEDHGGYREPSASLGEAYRAKYRNVREISGFVGIPKGEWRNWCEAVPLEDLVYMVRGTGKQKGGSCVGWSAKNGMEGPATWMWGHKEFVPLSAQSMYHFIGRSPGSGAYIPNAAERIDVYGMLPLDTPENRERFAHVHADGNFYADPPAGWQLTASEFRGDVYYCDDEEAWFACTMRDGLRVHLGRDRHAISGFAVFYDPDRKRFYWVYENSWGVVWGDFEKSIGYDSRMYPGYVYIPRLPSFIKVPVKQAG